MPITSEMVRLAGLLGTDDPEDIAQEAFARLRGRLNALGELHLKEVKSIEHRYDEFTTGRYGE